MTNLAPRFCAAPFHFSREERSINGRPVDFPQIEKAVANDEIDTVLACFVDMQGRLIGKRFYASFFVETAHDETHGCNYLLANDIDMEPVPGYEAASWDKGYGDFVMKPDLSTLRLAPWLEKTAIVLCDILDHHDHQDLAHSPRAILKKQLARLQERGYRAYFASELEFYLLTRLIKPPVPSIGRTWILPPLCSGLCNPPDHQGRTGAARHAQSSGRCRYSG